jgi:hypothetical protein
LRVVCDSSILISLGAIGRLTLLRQRFPEGILLPPAVVREVVQEGAGKGGAEEIKRSSGSAHLSMTGCSRRRAKVNPGAKFNAFLGRGAFLRMSRSKRAAALIRAIRVLRG